MNLKFINPIEVNQFTIKNLDEFRQRQFLTAGNICHNIKTKTLDELFAAMEEEGFLEDGDEGIFEFQQVVEEENPEKVLYDVWLMHVDTGTVFYADTMEETGVGMIQNDFDNIAGTPDGDELAAGLQKALRKRS